MTRISSDWTRAVRLHARLAVVAASLLAGGCGGSTDAALLTIAGSVALDVRQFDVLLELNEMAPMDHVTAPALPAASGIKLPATLSLTFPASLRGYIDVHVEARDATHVIAVANGFNRDAIVKGTVTHIDVTLAAVVPASMDGGTQD